MQESPGFIRVRRRARLVYTVTEGFKANLIADLESRLSRAASAIEAIDSLLKSAIEKDAPETSRLKQEQGKLLISRDETTAKLAQIKDLVINSEIAEGSVEIESELSVGDAQSRIWDAEIVISDGVIVEIRNP